MAKPLATRAWALLTFAGVTLAGCADLRYDNTVATLERTPKTRHESHVSHGFKACYFYPVRDWFERPCLTQTAWNTDANGQVANGSCTVNRGIGTLTAEHVATGPCTQPDPKQPFTITKSRRPDPRPTFFACDADGRTFVLKVDHRDWPELASAAEVIATRLMWALGYHVPANYLVRLAGTGRLELDGRRAVASEMLPGKIAGQWKLDWFRYRREFRALRLACAWLNDVDRVPNNCLVSVQDGEAVYYLLDFDSALGSWQGEPKPPWRSKRHVWDVEWQLAQIVTLGLVGRGYDPNQPIVSPAVGRFDATFDPIAWRAQLPNAAFDRMDDADARWMIARIAALTVEQIEAAVAAGELSDPADSRYIVATLLARREAILTRWPQPSVARK